MERYFELEDYYLETQLWPIGADINAERWLSNFLDNELPFAQELLRSFFFFNSAMCRTVMKHAYNRLVTYIVRTEGIEFSSHEEFCKSTIFTTVDIDDVNLAASGNLMCRWARQYLSVDETRIVNKKEALQILEAGHATRVIFLDDLIGSGLQFVDTWTLPIAIGTGSTMVAYSDIVETRPIRAYYIPLFATEYGIAEISKTCTGIVIQPGNFLEDRYNAFHPQSFIWSDKLRPDSQNFIREASKRAAISNRDWKGFHKLGLTIAFEHGIPDSTLPLFTWKSNTWKPLIDLR